MTLDDAILRKMEEAVRNERPHAAFFDWPDREVAELGVAKAFSEAAVHEPGLPFQRLESCGQGNDPPDCEATDRSGRRVAIEVTELVDGNSIVRAKRKAPPLWGVWSRQVFVAGVQERLDEKDAKELKGGPYDEYMVLIHTDEPELPIETVEAWLARHTFKRPRRIDRAYLLLSYDPTRKGYPYVRLAW
ncbi:MAG: hypothetical protein IRY91_16650 [Gemmatimonadaceae bacterium]|nr:hypothetical protein [Gemmatimonadaceae bacterium]